MNEKITVYTSYYANIKNLPDDIVPVSVSCVVPEGYNGAVYGRLAPTSGMMSAYKRSGDINSLTYSYRREILAGLNPFQVVSDLEKYIHEGAPPRVALICYEKPEDFCHRQLISRWLRKYGIASEEYTVKPEVTNE